MLCMVKFAFLLPQPLLIHPQNISHVQTPRRGSPGRDSRLLLRRLLPPLPGDHAGAGPGAWGLCAGFGAAVPVFVPDNGGGAGCDSALTVLHILRDVSDEE